MPDKRQDADGKEGLDYPGLPGAPTYRPKDGVPCGTYIEMLQLITMPNEIITINLR